MKTFSTSMRIGLGLLMFWGSIHALHADISVRLSVKFILNSDGTRPTGRNIDISTTAGFQAEVDWGNQVLAATGRGFQLSVVEYLDITPSAPSGQPSDYWYNLNARTNRQLFESAALADTTTTTWRWNSAALNIYVNNSSSGSCSFVGNGSSISLGGTIFTQGTIVHEIGHFFNLRHTHANDVDCTTTPGPYAPADGDSLAVTLTDHNCLNTIDLLSAANFGGRVFSALTAEEQARVNSSWLNVMSYHVESQLLDDQMDIWSDNANVSRLFACSGRTWFVSTAGSDIWLGDSAFAPFKTIPRAVSAISTPNDIIMLRAGNYTVPGSISTACTLRTMRGPTTITRQ
jgi:hypothetical protein